MVLGTISDGIHAGGVEDPMRQMQLTDDDIFTIDVHEDASDSDDNTWFERSWSRKQNQKKNKTCGVCVCVCVCVVYIRMSLWATQIVHWWMYNNTKSICIFSELVMNIHINWLIWQCGQNTKNNTNR